MRFLKVLVVSCVLGASLSAQHTLTLVEGGSFQPAGESKPIAIPDLYWMKHKVTIGEWKRFVQEAYPSFQFRAVADYIYGLSTPTLLHDDWPMAGITWLEAVRYCNWLSKKEGREPVYIITGADIPYQYGYSRQVALWPAVEINAGANGYRLPWKAEWQYAAMGGKKGIATSWWKTANLLQYGYFAENASKRFWPVGSLEPNPCGLYDLIGMAQEWTNDQYDGQELINGVVPGRIRVVVGAAIYHYSYKRPLRLVDNSLVQMPGTPDYFSESSYFNEWNRTYVGFRLVTAAP